MNNLVRTINTYFLNSIHSCIRAMRRQKFEEILGQLRVKLVVLVDDLERCLPKTAISTLEAMRLLLFVKRTAFIIAADEQMIRNGVRAYFNGVELSDGLVTSYFDKLIQVPIKIPHLGIAEVKVYIVLLFMELEVRRGKLEQKFFSAAQSKLSSMLSKAWEDDIIVNKIEAVFDDSTKTLMKESVLIADQLAGILVNADNIKGNPRLIKWLLIEPKLSGMDLRPLLYLSRDKVLSFAAERGLLEMEALLREYKVI